MQANHTAQRKFPLSCESGNKIRKIGQCVHGSISSMIGQLFSAVEELDLTLAVVLGRCKDIKNLHRQGRCLLGATACEGTVRNKSNIAQTYSRSDGSL